MSGEQLNRVSGPYALLHRCCLHEPVQPLHELKRKIRLRITRITLPKEGLPMQVGEFDDIVIDNRQLAHAGTGECRNDGATNSTGANDRNRRRLELTLS